MNALEITRHNKNTQTIILLAIRSILSCSREKCKQMNWNGIGDSVHGNESLMFYIDAPLTHLNKMVPGKWFDFHWNRLDVCYLGRRLRLHVFAFTFSFTCSYCNVASSNWIVNKNRDIGIMWLGTDRIFGTISHYFNWFYVMIPSKLEPIILQL